MLNGREVDVSVLPHETLVTVLRDRLGLTGTKVGCGSGEGGACTGIVDGAAVNSCVMLACVADGATVTTVEGLSKDGLPNGLQKAFIHHGAFQCGFCSSGMLMSATALLQQNSAPTDDEIREALQGNVCRCTGYVQILNAVRDARGPA